MRPVPTSVKFAGFAALFLLAFAYFVITGERYVPATLTIRGAADASRAELGVSWDSGAGWNRYERRIFRVDTRPGEDGLHTIEIRPTGRKNDASLGGAVVVEAIRIDGKPLNLKQRVTGGHFQATGIRLSDSGETARLTVPAESHIHIELATDDRSGEAAVSVNGNESVHDLYVNNIEARHIGVDRWVVAPHGGFTLTLALPRYAVRHLQIQNRHPVHPVHIRSVIVSSEKGEDRLGPIPDGPLTVLRFDDVNRGLTRWFYPAQLAYQATFAALTAWMLAALFAGISRCGGLAAALLDRRRRVFWICSAGSAAVFSLWLLAFWPGVMSVDSLKVWRAARLPEVMINDHPLVFVLLYMYLQQIWDHVAVVPVFHVLMLSLLVGHVLSVLYRARIPATVLTALFAGIVCSIPVGLYNVVLWKDIPFALLVVFWAFTLADLYRQRRGGRLHVGWNRALALFLLYLALGFIRHNGIVYLFVLPLLLVALGIVPVRHAVAALAAVVLLAAASLVVLRSTVRVDDARYLIDHGRQYAKRFLGNSLKNELVRTGRQYWGILDLYPDRPGWDFWHYYLKDREAYGFLRHSEWCDVYPYVGESPPVFPKLRALAMDLYRSSFENPWIYLTWNPVFMLALFPLTIVSFRWAPLSAIFSGIILVQVFTLLCVIYTLNWRYYYFVVLGAWFLPAVIALDVGHLKGRRPGPPPEECPMRFSVITANYNGGAFIEETLRSVIAQRRSGIALEYIVVDGMSTDDSLAIIGRYEHEIDRLIVERDTGPANAINKGFAAATGDVVAWLNADDIYYPDALLRVQKAMARHPSAPFCFGPCPIVDPVGNEIRKKITLFKRSFFPFSCRFLFQCINYISQPAMFMRKEALRRAGTLDETMTAAWDYALMLLLWRSGRAVCVTGGPLAAFRWYPGSIGGRNFRVQFKEELDCAVADAGPRSPQAGIHRLVRRAIVTIYAGMERHR